MTHDDRLDAERRLRRAVSDLPRELRPARDLWPGIAGRLDERPRSAVAGGWWRLAAAVVVTAGGLLMAVALGPTAPPAGSRAARVAQRPDATPAMAAPHRRQLDGVLHAHNDLVATVARRSGRLSGAEAAELAAGLAQLEKATAEIAAALDERPDDRRLQLALGAAYRRESEWTARLSRV